MQKDKFHVYISQAKNEGLGLICNSFVMYFQYCERYIDRWSDEFNKFSTEAHNNLVLHLLVLHY
jgi:hypothetical protein